MPYGVGTAAAAKEGFLGRGSGTGGDQRMWEPFTQYCTGEASGQGPTSSHRIGCSSGYVHGSGKGLAEGYPLGPGYGSWDYNPSLLGIICLNCRRKAQKSKRGRICLECNEVVATEVDKDDRRDQQEGARTSIG
jgi:hypothetical protein